MKICGRWLFVGAVAFLLLAASSALSSGQAALPRHARPLVVSNLTVPSGPVHEGVLTVDRLRKRALISPLAPYATADNMAVYVSFSDAYTADPAIAQSYVDFLDWLTHGPELNGLALYVLTPTEMATACGDQLAAACYFQNQLIVTGEDVGGVPIEQALAHEYGHHIANNRVNPPWPAVDWGPKRWATYENVCANVANGAMFPGAEQEPEYQSNPGEGWAEAYRRMNELRAGSWPDIGWSVVDPFFLPDPTALQLIERDVLDPWSGPSIYKKKGRLRRHGVRRWKLHPYDGPMTAAVTGPRGTTVSFVVGGGVARGPARRVSGLVCGAPAVTVVVRSSHGGRFSLRITEDNN